MTRFRSYSFGFALLALAAAANANTLRFDTDPFAGTDVLNQPGRQVVGGEPFLSVFRHSLFSFDGQAFGVGGPVRFANASAANIPAGGVNIVVLESFDDDDNPLTPFGAGNAANLIASHVANAGPGFFMYFNQNLNLPRLVYSTDLSSIASDLKILARFVNITGQDGRDAMPAFTAENFTITSAPEPSALWMVAPALAGFWRLRRRGKRFAAVVMPGSAGFLRMVATPHRKDRCNEKHR